MDRDAIWDAVHRERSALADLLETLSPQEWDHPTLCPGWAVRDVAAHVISSAQYGPADLVRALWRGRGDFDRAMYLDARDRGRRPAAEIVADYRRLDGSRRHPPGTSIREPLLDVLVHTQDIALPLGRRHAMPPEAARAAAERVWSMPFPFRARRRLRGLALVATDTAWRAGEGSEVRGSTEALLLLLTGRTAALDRLEGPGLPLLAPAPGAARDS
ncbi:maleylpyruvate isomerase family mycothiol-dependent enzyme [Kocuria sediminis]|uniref:Maleylpyruvate isomerase family mycothiol-dependent enzyme n=1 Tax=Kocuria sediminis TaxID=1038857 RepID=A0A6N8GU46_9MICC|nr:maleylpyruvate isomerase family mycothiol-dependent enzyme [Kocuria sediminis]MUN64334.1 maleylpyruvate isomerase family mycothiol-dependent enzyme [Kocuria sediminis]